MQNSRNSDNVFAGVNLEALPPDQRTLLEALVEVEAESRERERARQPLQDFIPSITPRWSSPRHLARLTDLFERIAQGERVRALVSVPPQHGKTETLLHALAWLLRRKPHLRNAYASYAAQLAFTKSRLARDYTLAAGVKLRDDANKVNEWVTTAGGGLLATGVGGPLTGNPVDGCFPAGTPVLTEHGPVEIQCLHRLHDRVRVLGFDHRSGSAVWCRIEASREIESDDLVEVVTCAGRRIRCTSDHRFYVQGQGYRAASLLCPGDRLVIGQVTQQQDVCRVWCPEGNAHGDVQALLRSGAQEQRNADVCVVHEDVSARGLRGGQIEAHGVEGLLLLEPLSVCSPSDQERPEVLPVRPAHAGQAGGKVLLAGLYEGRAEDRCRKAQEAEAAEAMRPLSTAVRPGEQSVSVLWSYVCERSARTANGGTRQSSLLDGNQLRETLQGDASADYRARWVCVSGVQGAGADVRVALAGSVCHADKSGGSPPRRESCEQRPEQSCHAVRHLPCSAPQVGDDAVALVQRLRGERVAVYDLQVEGQHNFFAGEVLVHNCLLIDDPHKNRAEAESAVIREEIKGWWTSTAMTRVHPQASVLVVHTRWHPDDLIGWLREGDSGKSWEVVELRAIADGTDPGDPRQPGEALWPEYMPADFLEERKRDVGPYDWASLYDQRPRPKGGSVFGDVHLASPPPGYRVVIGIDLAYTEKTSSDYSVAVVMAEVGRKFYILDLHRMQAPAPVFAERLRALQQQYPTARMVAYVGGTERGVVDLMNLSADGKARLSIEAKPAVADKFIRAQPVAAAWNDGRVFLPPSTPAWASAFVSEVRIFTGQKDRHDDQIDAMAAAYDALAAPSLSRSDLDKFRDQIRRPT